MVDSDSPEAQVRALRLAAERRDWSGCLSATEKLLFWLPPALALSWVREQVARRLPAFERHQPGVMWPRQIIESIGAAQSPDGGWRWPEEEDDFPGPGANNFLRAGEALCRASRLAGDARQRIEVLVDALANAILAEMLEGWGSRNPAEWARRYQLGRAGDGAPAVYEIQAAIVNDPETLRIKRAAWLDVADRLEAALAPHGGPSRSM